MFHSGSPELLNFISKVQKYVPGLEGRVGDLSTEEIVFGRDNNEHLKTVLDTLNTNHPEAGPNYWAVRTWGLSTWQPVMLSLAAVYGIGKALSLDKFGQHVHPGMIAGYTVQEDIFLETTAVTSVEPSFIQCVGEQVKDYCDAIKSELMSISALKSVAADRLLADRLLATLIVMRPYFFQGDKDGFDATTRHWLSAMGLDNASAVMTFNLPDGSEDFALKRKGCCLDYRKCDGKLCSTCPRQKLSVRIQRLQDDWSEHAAAN